MTFLPKNEADWVLCDDHQIDDAGANDISDLYDQSYVLVYEKEVNNKGTNETQHKTLAATPEENTKSARNKCPGSKNPYAGDKSQQSTNNNRTTSYCNAAQTDININSIIKACYSRKEEIVNILNNISITYEDLISVTGRNWLNDKIINGYLALISQSETPNKIYTHPTQWYQKVSCSTSGIQAVTEWTKEIHLRDYNFLLFPVNECCHWFLVVVDMRRKVATSLDSLHGENQSIVHLATQVVNADLERKKSGKLQFKYFPVDVSHQPDLDSCGVYLCYFSYIISFCKQLETIPDINTHNWRKIIITHLYRVNSFWI